MGAAAVSTCRRRCAARPSRRLRSHLSGRGEVLYHRPPPRPTLYSYWSHVGRDAAGSWHDESVFHDDLEEVLFHAAALRIERLALRHATGADDRTDGPFGMTEEEEMVTPEEVMRKLAAHDGDPAGVNLTDEEYYVFLGILEDAGIEELHDDGKTIPVRETREELLRRIEEGHDGLLVTAEEAIAIDDMLQSEFGMETMIWAVEGEDGELVEEHISIDEARERTREIIRKRAGS
jgi:hypothetical protein